MRVLVIGSGGREHALIWKLSQSPKVTELYCAPGNAGISKLAQCVPITCNTIAGVAKLSMFAKTNGIDLTVVGPEVPLVHGIVDAFKARNMRIFGPEGALAQLEGSKVYAKTLMKQLSIPTADFLVFDKADEAKSVIQFMDRPAVIKATGLTAGKGVFVCKNAKEATEAIEHIMVRRAFGTAGERIIVEKLLEGHEVSFMAFTDGKHIAPMPVVLDYKKAFANNQGPNTGGMGAKGPFVIEEAVRTEIIETILKPVIAHFAQCGTPYKGVIYAGLMLSSWHREPKVLEFNVRFGDPECQVLMMLLKTDLIDIIEAIEAQRLNELTIEWSSEYTKTVALVSGGYPNECAIGYEIDGLDREYPTKRFPNTRIFHAGTELVDGKVVTAGGRVLYVTTTGQNCHEENKLVVEDINFEHKYYRKDI